MPSWAFPMVSLLGNSLSSRTPSHPIFPSRVSGRGYKIGPVCVCVCLSVCHSALSRLNRLTHGGKIWRGD